MSYYLADANGYVDDFASIGGLRAFGIWAAGQGGVIARFVKAGRTDDPAGLAVALGKVKTTGPNEQLRAALEATAREAEGTLLLSDGVQGEGGDE